MFNRIKRKGFALTEVLLAIAVIVIIGIASYPLYRNARTNAMVEKTANQMAIIQTGAQKLYAGRGNYSGITLTQLFDTGQLSPDMIYPGTNVIVAPWNTTSSGGRYVLRPVTDGLFAANSAFSIGFQNIPQNVCTQLIPRIAPAFLAIGTSIGDGTIKGGTTAAPTSKVSLEAMNTACNGPKNSILYFTSR